MKEEDIILEKIEEMVVDFIEEYRERPKYVKLPIITAIKLREYAQKLMTNFYNKNLKDLEKEDFTVFGLRVCDTPAIKTIEEIEVVR